MKKIIVKRTYSTYESKQQERVTYIMYPIDMLGSEGESDSDFNAYRFDKHDLQITKKYENGVFCRSSDKNGEFVYKQELIEITISAKEYAINCHESTNHKYDGNKPYRVHLQTVVDTAMKFKNFIANDDLQDIIDACWCHDLIEDCRQTYNDVKEATNERVAQIVYAVTNEKGKNRAERGNEKYYEGIRNTPGACFVKLCDRIANYQYSKENGGRMCAMYEKEHAGFTAHFPSNVVNNRLIDHLNKLVSA